MSSRGSSSNLCAALSPSLNRAAILLDSAASDGGNHQQQQQQQQEKKGAFSLWAMNPSILSDVAPITAPPMQQRITCTPPPLTKPLSDNDGNNKYPQNNSSSSSSIVRMTFNNSGQLLVTAQKNAQLCLWDCRVPAKKRRDSTRAAASSSSSSPLPVFGQLLWSTVLDVRPMRLIIAPRAASAVSATESPVSASSTAPPSSSLSTHCLSTPLARTPPVYGFTDSASSSTTSSARSSTTSSLANHNVSFTNNNSLTSEQGGGSFRSGGGSSRLLGGGGLVVETNTAAAAAAAAQTLPPKLAPLLSVAFSKDDNLLVVGCHDGSVQFIDVGPLMTRMAEEDRRNHHSVFSDDDESPLLEKQQAATSSSSTAAAAASSSSAPSYASLVSLSPTRIQESDAVTAIVLSDQCDYCATATAGDYVVRVWSIETVAANCREAAKSHLLGAERSTLGVASSSTPASGSHRQQQQQQHQRAPSGRLGKSASFFLKRSSSAGLLRSFRGHLRTIYSLAFEDQAPMADEPLRIASASRDGTVRVWSFRPEESQELRSRGGRISAAISRTQSSVTQTTCSTSVPPAVTHTNSTSSSNTSSHHPVAVAPIDTFGLSSATSSTPSQPPSMHGSQEGILPGSVDSASPTSPVPSFTISKAAEDDRGSRPSTPVVVDNTSLASNEPSFGGSNNLRAMNSSMAGSIAGLARFYPSDSCLVLDVTLHLTECVTSVAFHQPDRMFARTSMSSIFYNETSANIFGPSAATASTSISSASGVYEQQSSGAEALRKRTLIGATSTDGRLRIFDGTTGRLLYTFNCLEEREQEQQNQHRPPLVVQSPRHRLALLKRHLHQQQHRPPLHPVALVFHRDGRFVASINGAGTIHVLSLETAAFAFHHALQRILQQSALHHQPGALPGVGTSSSSSAAAAAAAAVATTTSQQQQQHQQLKAADGGGGTTPRSPSLNVSGSPKQRALSLHRRQQNLIRRRRAQQSFRMTLTMVPSNNSSGGNMFESDAPLLALANAQSAVAAQVHQLELGEDETAARRQQRELMQNFAGGGDGGSSGHNPMDHAMMIPAPLLRVTSPMGGLYSSDDNMSFGSSQSSDGDVTTPKFLPEENLLGGSFEQRNGDDDDGSGGGGGGDGIQNVDADEDEEAQQEEGEVVAEVHQPHAMNALSYNPDRAAPLITGTALERTRAGIGAGKMTLSSRLTRLAMSRYEVVSPLRNGQYGSVAVVKRVQLKPHEVEIQRRLQMQSAGASASTLRRGSRTTMAGTPLLMQQQQQQGSSASLIRRGSMSAAAAAAATTEGRAAPRRPSTITFALDPPNPLDSIVHDSSSSGNFVPAVQQPLAMPDEVYVQKTMPLRKDAAFCSRMDADIMSNCLHPFIVHYVEQYESFGNLNLIMEHCAGGDIGRKIEKLEEEERQRSTCDSGLPGALMPMPWNETLAIFTEACLGVDYMHRNGMVHKDIKTQNLLLDGDGFVKLTDFGFATRIFADYSPQDARGTPRYIAPEIWHQQPHGTPVDVWSLGVLFYVLVTSKYPFEVPDSAGGGGNLLKLSAIVTGEPFVPLSQAVQGLSPHSSAWAMTADPTVRKLVGWMLEKNPSRRATAAQVLMTLEQRYGAMTKAVQRYEAKLQALLVKQEKLLREQERAASSFSAATTTTASSSASPFASLVGAGNCAQTAHLLHVLKHQVGVIRQTTKL